MKNLKSFRKGSKDVKRPQTALLILFVLELFTLASCSKNEPLSLNPIKTKIVNVDSDVFTKTMKENSISNYIEIIDGTYSMIPINDGKDWRIDIKLKSLKTADSDDEFEISGTGYTPGGTGLYLVDDAGTIIEEWGGVGAFELVNRDVLVDYLKSGEGECMLRFENDAYKFEDHLKTPEKVAGFVIKTSAYKKTAEYVVAQTAYIAAGGNSTKINEFRSLLNQYIALDKKLDDIDLDSPKWDKVYDEYDKVEDQLFDLQEEIWVLDDENKLTASELSSFTSLSNKFDDY